MSEECKGSGNKMILPCHAKKIPLWLVWLDNVPTLVLIILGIILVSKLSATGAVFFGFYAAFSIVWFWAKICPHCHHYNTLACPCGYGIVSSRFFRKGKGLSFKKVFRRNIITQFPNWFVPLVVAIYLLSMNITKELIVLTASFVLIGFVIIPFISKWVGCKNCEIKEDCPWMTIHLKEKSDK